MNACVEKCIKSISKICKKCKSLSFNKLIYPRNRFADILHLKVVHYVWDIYLAMKWGGHKNKDILYIPNLTFLVLKFISFLQVRVLLWNMFHHLPQWWMLFKTPKHPKVLYLTHMHICRHVHMPTKFHQDIHSKMSFWNLELVKWLFDL